MNEETVAALPLTEREATCALDALYRLNEEMREKMPNTWLPSQGKKMVERLTLRITDLWQHGKWGGLKPVILSRLEALMLRDAMAMLTMPVEFPIMFPGSLLEQIHDDVASVTRKVYESLDEIWAQIKR